MTFAPLPTPDEAPYHEDLRPPDRIETTEGGSLLELHRLAITDENSVSRLGERDRRLLVDLETSFISQPDLLARAEATAVLARIVQSQDGSWNPIAAQALIADALVKDPELLTAVQLVSPSAHPLCVTIYNHHCARNLRDEASMPRS